MDYGKVSVIVPIYNTKPYLKECVDSILKQEVEVPFEVLRGERQSYSCDS